MNFQEEEKNMLEFQEYNKNVPYIRIPKVIQKYTTHHLIVMEYMDGVKINDVTALKYLGYDAHDIAMKLSQNYIKQALDDGFYHADPHPDNLKILNSQIVYLDFGMMGRLNAANKKIMKDCMMNIILRDYENLTHNILLFGTTSPVNERVLETDLQKTIRYISNNRSRRYRFKGVCPFSNFHHSKTSHKNTKRYHPTHARNYRIRRRIRRHSSRNESTRRFKKRMAN